MSWRMESMPMVSCHAAGWSVTIFSTCEVVFRCFCCSLDDVPVKSGGAGVRGEDGLGTRKATILKHLTGHRNPNLSLFNSNEIMN